MLLKHTNYYSEEIISAEIPDCMQLQDCALHSVKWIREYLGGLSKVRVEKLTDINFLPPSPPPPLSVTAVRLATPLFASPAHFSSNAIA